MKVCYFGSYDKEYPRNRILIKGLRQNNIDVIECQDSSKSLIRYVRLLWKYSRVRENYEAIIIGAADHSTVPFAKILSPKKKIIFDVFISFYDTAVFDRKLVRKDTLKAKYYYFLDWVSCELPDIVITDTLQHAKYFSKEFGIPFRKIKVIYIGADEYLFYPRDVGRRDNNRFLVEFHGTFVPLQGIQYIVEAAKILERENIIFKIIGKGQTYQDVLKLAKKLNVKNARFLGWVDYESIPNYISEADVCLGIFGDTEKAKRVIPNKAFEALAMKKPLITGNSPAAKEVFTHKKNVVLCKMGDSESLAEAILTLRDDEKLRSKIASDGFNLFKNKFTSKKLGERLKNIIEEELE